MRTGPASEPGPGSGKRPQCRADQRTFGLPDNDSLEKQRFFLGEALTTECEVSVDGTPGYGLCLGEEPLRCYSIAVVDALLYRGASPKIGSFLEHHRHLITEREQREFNLTLRTQ